MSCLSEDAVKPKLFFSFFSIENISHLLDNFTTANMKKNLDLTAT